VTSSTDAGNATVSYTYYSDGKIATMTTSGGNVTVSVAYDDAGNRTSLNDADYGQTTSVYDAYGRLVQQTTPKGDNSYYTYDVLGRITQKTVPSDTTTTSYQYNESTHKGTLASVTHNGQLMQYAYDSYDRLTTVTETRSDTTYTTSYTYNNNSQISSKTYPSGYKVFYGYFSNGTKKHVKDINGNTLWKTNRINPSGQLLRATTGNSAVTNNRYDAATNRLTGSVTSNGIQNFAYTFDGFGNLTSRTDSIGTVKTETFTYDNLDRLTGITLNNVSSTIVYDSYGRMTSKQKDGSTVFSSAQFSQHKPHATRSVSTTSIEFPQSQSIEYNSLDKVKRLAQDRRIVTFTYGYDGQRTRMTVTDTLTGRTKTKDYVGSCEFVDDNGTKKVYTYLMGPYGVFAMVEHSGGTDAVHYVYKDHLGSWTAITDAAGFVEERLSFDAWGNLRDASTWTSVPSRLPRFDRGFTGHEHLYSFGLINMNGRMYDPLLSSFLSPDNYMQDPTSQQGFNRYAYCMYNPLKYVDPTGEQYFGWSGGSLYQIEQEARRVVRQIWRDVYDNAILSHQLTLIMANAIYSNGPLGGGVHGSNGSGNHGSGGGGIGGGGGQDGPNKNRPLIIINDFITDNDSPIYKFVIYNTNESSENNTSYFSELKKFFKENTKYFFIDGAAALDFMYENSFDENMNPYKEISAWVVDGGIIVQPWYDNKERESRNTPNLSNSKYYEFQGEMYFIEAQIHTHPNYDNGYIGVSSDDLRLNDKVPVYIIYNSSLYKAGNPTIRLDQTRNINYYNWYKYFKY
jgi:RHS repeat-associated protein